MGEVNVGLPAGAGAGGSARDRTIVAARVIVTSPP
jgi:hypothetical protein